MCPSGVHQRPAGGSALNPARGSSARGPHQRHQLLVAVHKRFPPAHQRRSFANARTRHRHTLECAVLAVKYFVVPGERTAANNTLAAAAATGVPAACGRHGAER